MLQFANNMDLKIYVDAIIQKLHDANCYSEVGEPDMRLIIEKYLTKEYNDRIAILNLQIDIESSQGVLKDMEYYRSKVTDIKSHIITLTREVGKISLD